MTVRECNEFQSAFYPRWDEKVFRRITGHFGLKAEARVRDLSRGERAGLCLALTLAPDPELLVLDDPALGLDPVARRSLVESMIYLTRRPDRTILFSSHDLADVERVADFVAVMDQSVLRACGTLDMFRKSVQQVRLRFAGAPPPSSINPGFAPPSPKERELRVSRRAFTHRPPNRRCQCQPTDADGNGPAQFGRCVYQLSRWSWRERGHPLRNGSRAMKTLFQKELRENLKAAALGMLVFIILTMKDLIGTTPE